MTVQELIDLLNEYEPDLEVRTNFIVPPSHFGYCGAILADILVTRGLVPYVNEQGLQEYRHVLEINNAPLNDDPCLSEENI